MNTTPPPSDIQPLFPVLSGVQVNAHSSFFRRDTADITLTDCHHFIYLFPAQMLHGPGDLRHDLERRRQKRLEGVTVTIQGGRHPPPTKDEYADGMLPDERDCRRDGNTVSPKARVAQGRPAILNRVCVRAGSQARRPVQDEHPRHVEF